MYLKTLLYKLPTKAVTGTDAAHNDWKFSQQHVFELGRWDVHVAPHQPPKQEIMRGFVRTRRTWHDQQPSRVRIWREKGPKITEANIGETRQQMLIHLDPDTSLPTQKYDAPFKLDVLKK